jgi:hypothetical protein
MQAPRVVGSSRTWANIVLGGLVIGVVLDLLSAFNEVNGKSLIEAYVAGSATQSDLVAWDDRFSTIALGQTAIFILTAIVWLVWQFRMVASVEPLTHDAPVKTPWRSIGWWFVPFANLVTVPRIYNDLKDKLTSGGGSMVGWWWGMYIVANAVTNFASRQWNSATGLDGLLSALDLWIVADLLSVVSAVLAFRLVRHLQRGQDALIAAPSAPIAVNTLSQPAEAVSPAESS